MLRRLGLTMSWCSPLYYPAIWVTFTELVPWHWAFVGQSPAPEFLQIHGWMVDLDQDRILYLSLPLSFSYAIMFPTIEKQYFLTRLSIFACSLLILRSRVQQNNWICSKSEKLELLSFLLLQDWLGLAVKNWSRKLKCALILYLWRILM